MADKKITQLNPLDQASSNDVLPIVDVATPETKKITIEDLFASPTAIGSANPDTGVFTTLELSTGSTVSEFSTDVTLGGDSDTAVPTEKAVKTYIDNQISGFDFTNIRSVFSDTTASNGDVLLVDTTSGDVNIVVNVTNGLKVSIKKITSDGNNVNISASSGTIDGAVSVTISDQNQSFTLVSNGVNVFII